jgi:hypothetical protein
MNPWMDVCGYVDVWILGKVMDSEMISRSKERPIYR